MGFYHSLMMKNLVKNLAPHELKEATMALSKIERELGFDRTILNLED